MKKVLLTGAGGFIGRHVLPALIKHGYEVHATFYPGEPIIVGDESIITYECDLLNSKDRNSLIEEIKPTHLLHLAWYTKPKIYWEAIENVRWVEASLDLAVAFSELGGERAVFAGTCAEYDWSYGYCSETVTPVRPSTLYGICKNSLHGVVSQLSKLRGFSYAWSRIFFTYGPHEKPERLVSAIITGLLKGEIVQCSSGIQMRDFLFVEDLAFALATLLESEVNGPVNIGSGQPVAIKTVVTMIAEKLGKIELVEFKNRPLLESQPLLLLANVNKLTSEVGWRPEHTLEEGIDLTINWLKREL
jgi:nucleoside-diphosphate-sugar epimerase